MPTEKPLKAAASSRRAYRESLSSKALISTDSAPFKSARATESVEPGSRRAARLAPRDFTGSGSYDLLDADPFRMVTQLRAPQQSIDIASVGLQSAVGNTDSPVQNSSGSAVKKTWFRRVITGGVSAGVMGIAGMLAVGMTVPTQAVAAAGGANAATSLVAHAGSAESAESVIPADEIQAFVAPATVANEAVTRSESFSSVSLAEVAGELGIRFSNSLYTNDPSAAIQWPFAVGVAMSSTYGMRDGTMHEGIDLVPGEGAPIQSIADGTVRIATEDGGAYGVTVYIDHVIDGKVVTSHYSHMLYGSLQVRSGQQVTVGTVIGNTGNTGRSYGAHLHFELTVNGEKIDPLPWLKANAGRR